MTVNGHKNAPNPALGPTPITPVPPLLRSAATSKFRCGFPVGGSHRRQLIPSELPAQTNASVFGRSIIVNNALLLCMFLFLLASCSRASDAELRKNLPGVWRLAQSPQQNRSMVIILTFTPSADFTNQLVFPGAAREIDMFGTYHVQAGYLICTVTRNSQKTAEKLPLVLRSKIIQADESQFVVVAAGTTNTQTFTKETK